MVADALTPSPASLQRRATLAAVVVAGVTFALWAEWLRFTSHWPVAWILVDFVPGLAFLVCGYFGAVRRPDTPIGRAMIAAGFAWYSGTAAASQDPVIDRLGVGFQGYYDGILAWLALAFPTGRIQGWLGRFAVIAAFGVLAARTVFRLLTFRMSTDYDFTAPGEVDRFVAEMTMRDTGEAAFGLAFAGVMAIVLILLVVRLRTESSVARRIAWPMIVAGVALAVGILVEVGAITLATTPEDRFGAWALADILTSVTAAGVAVAFLASLLGGRLARRRVADLVVELGGAGDRLALREVVARALRDPTAELLYPATTPGAFMDPSGRPRDLGGPDAARRSVTRIEAGGDTVAVLVHDRALDEQPELLRSVIAAVRLAIENERLAAEVRAQLAEVDASRARIVAAGDEQRRRIERDLHDGAQQRLVTLALRLQMARAAAPPEAAEVRTALDAAAQEAEAAIGELRELARGLHPSILATDGLGAALELLAERASLPVEVAATPERFDVAIETAAYFVVAEALTNVARSARAAKASVEARREGDRLVVEVRDDGVGGADPSRGSGLRGLEDRVAAVGGRLVVDSPAGKGTRVRAELPCG